MSKIGSSKHRRSGQPIRLTQPQSSPAPAGNAGVATSPPPIPPAGAGQPPVAVNNALAQPATTPVAGADQSQSPTIKLSPRTKLILAIVATVLAALVGYLFISGSATSSNLWLIFFGSVGVVVVAFTLAGKSNWESLAKLFIAVVIVVGLLVFWQTINPGVNSDGTPKASIKSAWDGYRANRQAKAKSAVRAVARSVARPIQEKTVNFKPGERVPTGLVTVPGDIISYSIVSAPFKVKSSQESSGYLAISSDKVFKSNNDGEIVIYGFENEGHVYIRVTPKR